MLQKLLVLLLIACCTTQNLFAQSGRGRPSPDGKPAVKPVPPPVKPSPSTPPSTSGKIGPGATITDQSQSGLTTRYVFKNGLTVIISEDHSSPLVSLAASIKAGTADEPETARGAAHVAGAALLHGTAQRPGELWVRQMAAAGASFDTNVDATGTEYLSSAPVESLTPLLELSADALIHPAFSEEAVSKSVKAVQRELAAQGEDAALYSAGHWLNTAYPQHPLGRTEPTPEQLAALKRDAVVQFHSARYTPHNTVVCLSGDIIAPVVLRTVQQFFGNWAGGTTAVAKLPEIEQTALRYQEERGATTTSWVHLGYAMPTAAVEDVATWDVLRAVLGLGRGARLVQSLRDARGIVSDIRTDFISRRNLSHFLIGLRVLPESIDRAEALTIEMVERLRRERISDAELQRAKSLLEKEFITRTETTEGRARFFAGIDTASAFKSWSEYPPRLRKVTAEQVRAAAAKYLTVARLTVHEYQPPSAPPRTFTPEKYAETVGLLVPASTQAEIPADAVTDAKSVTPVKQGAPRETQQDVGKFIVMAQAEPVKDYSTLRGPRAFVRADPTRPLLTVGLFFQGGRSVEDETNCGVTELMLRAMLCGTAKQPGDTLSAEMEQLGGEIRVINEMDYFGLEVEILSRNGEEGLKRLIDVLENPTFDKEAVKRERNRLLADQLAAREAGAEQSAELARTSLFPTHTYGYPRLGTTTGISKLTESDLQKWLDRTVKRQLPLAVIVGDTDGSALVARVLANGFTRNELDKSIKVRIVDPLAQPAEVSGAAVRPVSYATWLWGAPDGRNSAAPEWRVMSEVLAARLAQAGDGTGTGSGFFASSFIPHLQHSEFLITAGGTSSDEPRLKSTVDTMVKTLDHQEVSDEEWQGARRRAAAHAAQEIESFSGRTLSYTTAVYLGLPAVAVEQNVDAILHTGRERAPSVVSTMTRNVPGRGVVRGMAK